MLSDDIRELQALVEPAFPTLAIRELVMQRFSAITDRARAMEATLFGQPPLQGELAANVIRFVPRAKPRQRERQRRQQV
jgi:hypothetical protein